MAIKDRLEARRQEPPVEVTEVPKDIEERTARGRARMREGAPRRTECLKFWRGDQYVYRGDQGILVNQSTITIPGGGGKPRHRVRTVRNLLTDIVAHEVSAATQRVPAYEVNPSTSDPEDIAAARLGDKVARYGYDKWSLRNVTEKVVTYAVVADEGFAWPFWDSSIGPYLTDENDRAVGEGEVGVRVFGPNECYWEPGLKFEESPYHAIEQARTLDSVYAMEGYIGGQLKADASSDEIERERDSQHSKLVMVTEYLERPCPKYPNGRWLTLANGKVIVGERPYPCVDASGRVVDEPVLHKLSYITDPDSDRDQGLVRHLIDGQRTVNDCINKMLEWKNLMMNPQIIIRNGEFKQQLTDEPGAVYHAVGSGEITIREVGEVPQSLHRLKEEAINDMARISAQNDIPSQVESGKGIQALIEKDTTRRAPFIANVAEFHSRFMRHCLYLVQKHYTEERQLKIRGRTGPDVVRDFKGAQLRGQADVTVLPGSLEPRSRAAIESKIIAFADRGWVSPEAAMAAINGGTAENLVESYELDVGRANQIIQMIADGTFDAQPPRPVFVGEDPGYEIEPVYATDDMGQPIIDPMTGAPQELQPGVLATTMPGWMPRPFDNVRVHLAVFSDWMKTPDFMTLAPDQMQAANSYYAALQAIQEREAIKEAQMQQAQAEALGMGNAAKPQKASPNPDMPSGNGAGEPSGEVFRPRYQTGSQTTF